MSSRTPTVIVDGNRITAVGPSSSVAVPAGAQRIDVNGLTIMPGIIDAHAHVGGGSNGITRQRAVLRKPRVRRNDHARSVERDGHGVQGVGARGKSGSDRFAARIFDRYDSLWRRRIVRKPSRTTFDDALTHLRRMQAVGAFSVKSYNQPRRDARQQIIEAARQLN